ncbi:alpha/beta hydrolase [Mycobacterium sp. 663a-19]|uniref:alpha/beta hydrolase n=1 Tax=Mycobacterium sp. 663a-19 TaxID=2986148 RepID=UPI002D1EB9E5|nr:alpha/beta hydrolase [Mycobacterium sp. 663a-19]MEB3979706.1 alpha/beta hydrolase [Mycobacterium sp. 663a-19]
MAELDEAEVAKREVAQRMSEAFASMRDGTAVAAEVRASLKASRKPRRHVPVARVKDRTVPGAEGAGEIPVRIYHPIAPDPSGAGTPLLVYLHGGGFVLCDLDSHDACCRRLANGVGAIVVSVDYRLAPENPYPAAVEDAWAATQWVAKHGGELGGDTGRLVLAGDSAGGNLATVVCMISRDRGGPPIAFQLLVYPVVDQRRKPKVVRDPASRGVLTLDHQRWFTQQYLGPDGDQHSPYASPILGDLTGLPPAHVVTGEFDPLCDDGEEFAERLRAAGVPATVRRYPGMFHGFFNLPDDILLSEQANADVCAVLREALNTDKERELP